MSRRFTLFLPLLAALSLFAALPALASAHSVKWHGGVRIEPASNGGLTAVSCASASLCVAGDQSGRVLTSTKPTATSGAWSGAALVDKYGGITGLSCPTSGLCVAVDDSGVLVYSKNPTGGASAWSHPVRIDKATFPGGGYVGFNSLSCPTSTLCVATDASPRGQIWWSTNPTGGAAAWHSNIEAGPLSGVSCASSALCEAVGFERLSSINPAAGGTTWKAAGLLAGGLYSAVDCPTAAMCVAVGYGNTGAAFSTGTKTPTGAWGAQIAVGGTTIPPAGSGVLDTVGCTEGTCVTIDSSEDYYATSGIVNGSWNGGAAIRLNPSRISNAISCKDLVCVVVDSAGVETTGTL